MCNVSNVLIVVIFFICFPLVFSTRGCARFTTRTKCLVEQPCICGWCADSNGDQGCMRGTSDGPTGHVCSGEWEHTSDQCRVSKYSTARLLCFYVIWMWGFLAPLVFADERVRGYDDNEKIVLFIWVSLLGIWAIILCSTSTTMLVSQESRSFLTGYSIVGISSNGIVLCSSIIILVLLGIGRTWITWFFSTKRIELYRPVLFLAIDATAMIFLPVADLPHSNHNYSRPPARILTGMAVLLPSIPPLISTVDVHFKIPKIFSKPEIHVVLCYVMALLSLLPSGVAVFANLYFVGWLLFIPLAAMLPMYLTSVVDKLSGLSVSILKMTIVFGAVLLGIGVLVNDSDSAPLALSSALEGMHVDVFGSFLLCSTISVLYKKAIPHELKASVSRAYSSGGFIRDM